MIATPEQTSSAHVLRLAGLFVPLTLRCPCFAAVQPGLLSGRSQACCSPLHSPGAGELDAPET
jgi:hypothetical protein